ncbi:hypothetical protein Q9233_007739 [Columba guinea]|nr:hypothetical protein Q9233_007739 [Columba guinea]
MQEHFRIRHARNKHIDMLGIIRTHLMGTKTLSDEYITGATVQWVLEYEKPNHLQLLLYGVVDFCIVDFCFEQEEEPRIISEEAEDGFQGWSLASSLG